VDASRSMDQFLARADEVHSYRALRRLEASGAGKSAWLEAWTDFAPGVGFRYEIVGEGGSEYIRNRVLRAVLDGEKNLIARNAIHRSAIDSSNYRFEPLGVEETGLVKIRLAPRRNDDVLLNGNLFLQKRDGDLVRVEGRMAKNPSFWVNKVDIVRTYGRIAGALLPVDLSTTANVRLLGQSSLRMTYTYSTVDGRPAPSGPSRQ
jgi:hypothetical protein